MQLYQNNEAFVLCAVGIKQETERDGYWGNRCWLNLGSVPCFLKLFTNPVRIAPPDSTVLKVLWAPFRTKKCMSSQSTAVPSDFVYFPANRHVFRDSNDKCLEYLFWSLWVTFLMPLFSPSVKWEMSPYQVLESINTKGSWSKFLSLSVTKNLWYAAVETISYCWRKVNK